MNASICGGFFIAFPLFAQTAAGGVGIGMPRTGWHSHVRMRQPGRVGKARVVSQPGHGLSSIGLQMGAEFRVQICIANPNVLWALNIVSCSDVRFWGCRADSRDLPTSRPELKPLAYHTISWPSFKARSAPSGIGLRRSGRRMSRLRASALRCCEKPIGSTPQRIRPFTTSATKAMAALEIDAPVSCIRQPTGR